MTVYFGRHTCFLTLAVRIIDKAGEHTCPWLTKPCLLAMSSTCSGPAGTCTANWSWYTGSGSAAQPHSAASSASARHDVTMTMTTTLHNHNRICDPPSQYQPSLSTTNDPRHKEHPHTFSRTHKLELIYPRLQCRPDRTLSHPTSYYLQQKRLN